MTVQDLIYHLVQIKNTKNKILIYDEETGEKKEISNLINVEVGKFFIYIRTPKIKPEITVHNRKEYLTMAVFKSKRSGEIYKVKKSYNLLTDQAKLTCNCKGYIHYQKCKHLNYVMTYCQNNNDKINFDSYNNPIEI